MHLWLTFILLLAGGIPSVCYPEQIPEDLALSTDLDANYNIGSLATIGGEVVPMYYRDVKKSDAEATLSANITKTMSKFFVVKNRGVEYV